MPGESEETVDFVDFNKDTSCLLVATSRGYRVYSDEGHGFRRVFKLDCGSFGYVGMVGRSVLALVGTGHSSGEIGDGHSPRQLQLWDAQKGVNLCNISFADTILAVKLNQKRLVIILEKALHLFDLTTMKPLRVLDTDPNKRGLGELSACEEKSLVAYPSSSKLGELSLVTASSGSDLAVIKAHESPLAAIAMSRSGHRVATASTLGTIIRVWNTQSTSHPLCATFRRGSTPADIYSLAFNESRSLLAASSNRETVHIFKCDAASVQDPAVEEYSWYKCRGTFRGHNVVAFSADDAHVLLASHATVFRYHVNLNALRGSDFEQLQPFELIQEELDEDPETRL